MKENSQIMQIVSKNALFLGSVTLFSAHGHCHFEFLDWLEACLLLNIAKCELDTFAQLYFLNFVHDLLIGQSKRLFHSDPL